jgi:hypothetical protein
MKPLVIPVTSGLLLLGHREYAVCAIIDKLAIFAKHGRWG